MNRDGQVVQVATTVSFHSTMTSQEDDSVAMEDPSDNEDGDSRMSDKVGTEGSERPDDDENDSVNNTDRHDSDSNDGRSEEEEDDDDDQGGKESSARGDSENDSDDESRSNAGSNDKDSSDSESESDGDGNDDKDGDDGNGMSAYERLRQERIKRNNLLLKELGVGGKEGGGMLGKKRRSQTKRRNSSSERTSMTPKRRSRRSTGQQVSYAEPSLRDLKTNQKIPYNPPDSTGDNNVEAAAPKPRKSRPSKGDRTQRMARFVYDEFSRIRQHKKLMLKEAEKAMKSAETEEKYWRKKAAVREKREQKKMEAERHQKQIEEEKKLYGTSIRSFVHSLERRSSEISAKIAQYDLSRQTREQQVEIEARRLETDNRLKVLDALDSYPRAMKVSIPNVDLKCRCGSVANFS